MKHVYHPLPYFTCLLLSALATPNLFAQTAITAVTISNTTAAAASSYVIGTNTYNWGTAPNNNVVLVDGFTAGGLPYTYASFLTGNVKLRRVNNASVSGNFTLIWAETVTNGTTFNMLPDYQGDMEPFFNNRVYNKGTDNFFDNTSGNSNNIERLDWIVSAGFSTAAPAKLGFAIFERGTVGAHDPFCIAAITSLDGLGNPASYGPIVRVATASYGDPGPAVSYRILKAAQPGNLADAGTNSQNRGGVIVSLQNLGVAANATIYGYSLFSNDLPAGATPANLLDVTNTTYFPTNTGNPGGIDLIAITGLYIETALLPVQFTGFAASEKNGHVQLQWQVEGETANTHYYVVEANKGNGFTPLGQLPANPTANGRNQYTFIDSNGLTTAPVQYRIRQVDMDGRFVYSAMVKLSAKKTAFTASVYPNPVVGSQLTVQVTAAKATNGQFRLTDLQGRTVFNRSVNIASGQQVCTMDVANLPAGRYQLLVQTAADRQVMAVTKL